MNHPIRLIAPAILVAYALLVLSAPPASAVIIRHDRDDARYLELAKKFPAVGEIIVYKKENQDEEHARASGILIGPRHVLTASHNFLMSFVKSAAFEVNGKVYAGEKMLMFPGSQTWVPLEDGKKAVGVDFNLDMGMLQLKEPVTDVEPAKLARFRHEENKELGKEAVFVGFGFTGDGLKGAVGEAGTKRACTNRIDAIGYFDKVFRAKHGGVKFDHHVMLADFDAPPGSDPDAKNYFDGPSEPLDLEGGTATSDSGGGVFIDFGNGPELCGIFSGTNGPSRGPTNKYGSYYRMIRVAPFLDWIDEQMKGN